MQSSAEDILKKITYIEAEIEIQKQILYSLSDDEEKNIENVLKKIKQAKDRIAELRQTLAVAAPEEYQKILTIEKAIAGFTEITAGKQFSSIESMTSNPQCSLTMRNGEQCSCLVKARDTDGNWTIITSDGQIRQLDREEVAE